MDKEVEPVVLAAINEKRLVGEKRTPSDILAKMGVFDARQKVSDSAWLATGDNVIATLWAEIVNIGANGRWFYLESLDAHRRVGGGERSAMLFQRAKDRQRLLKRTLDAGHGFRALLQTNRVAFLELEKDKAAKASVRVPDDEEWHVAVWDTDRRIAVMVRGPRDWRPAEDEIQAAWGRSGIAVPVVEVPSGPVSPEQAQAAAMAHLTAHFAGYGYKPESVGGTGLGYDIQVLDKKGNALLKLAVRGSTATKASFPLTDAEQACAKSVDQWRLAIVTDAGSPAAQHKLYKVSELDQEPGVADAG